MGKFQRVQSGKRIIVKGAIMFEWELVPAWDIQESNKITKLDNLKFTISTKRTEFAVLKRLFINGIEIIPTLRNKC